MEYEGRQMPDRRVKNVDLRGMKVMHRLTNTGQGGEKIDLLLMEIASCLTKAR
jgi:hypothetical protein